ncbi:unnamed protein product [Owenia fusiformis]|uniref:Uncharacterized protein n=1 Tax=Owenia fusiformis TaxID=6347 RepID=A0A8J1XJU5_OWEFU|nr:unnamed protein product [Owenia fusiformis]
MSSKSVYAVDMSQLKDIPIFWLKKSVTKVMATDFNKNGVWDTDDCRIAAEKLIKAGNLKGAKAEEVHMFNLQLPHYFRTANNITEWLRGEFNFSQDPNSRPYVYEYIAKWFRVLDLNGDGVIDLNEYKVFWDAYDLDPNYMKRQFDYIDEDEDGKITYQEYVEAALNYFCNTKENANIFWGPIQYIQKI